MKDPNESLLILRGQPIHYWNFVLAGCKMSTYFKTFVLLVLVTSVFAGNLFSSIIKKLKLAWT